MQYVLMTIYQKSVGQSIGDINVFTDKNLNAINEQIRSASVIDKLAMIQTKLQIDIRIPFST